MFMDYSKKTFLNAINKKFVRPINDGCRSDVNRLTNNGTISHQETIDLLKQAYTTLESVNRNLEKNDWQAKKTLL